jgi:predicted transcriptional regulator
MEMPEDVYLYWEAFQDEVERRSVQAKEKQMFTPTGEKIFTYLQENYSIEDKWDSAEIAKGLGLTAKNVSGSLRRLVTDGYVKKVCKDPVMYSLTQLGIDTSLDERNRIT